MGVVVGKSEGERPTNGFLAETVVSRLGGRHQEKASVLANMLKGVLMEDSC